MILELLFVIILVSSSSMAEEATQVDLQTLGPWALSDAHIHLSSQSGHVLLDNRQFRDLTIISAKAEAGVPEHSRVVGRSLAADVSDKIYGEYASNPLYPYLPPNSVWIQPGNHVEFDTLTFTDSCSSVGMYSGSTGGYYGEGVPSWCPF